MYILKCWKAEIDPDTMQIAKDGKIENVEYVGNTLKEVMADWHYAKLNNDVTKSTGPEIYDVINTDEISLCLDDTKWQTI